MDKNEKHKIKAQKQKQKVDANVAKAQIERGIMLVITGKGKGKSTAGFGTVCRAVGHGYKAAVVQFIKGKWDCGERDLLEQHGVPFAVMGTGFTWETQNRETDIAAAENVWQQAKKFLADPDIHLVLLDEMTYMLGYDYLNKDEVLSAIANRPENQSVVVTGRGAITELKDMADTVSEIKDVKHAFREGIKARKGVDW
ncbi:cob(I)yrinic acid a,c-diamide adenosyltransferase [Pleionea mediterranea]|jgi:cob(I)alamin adenosyltransferase|uniref:Corrinoid adenosyltransferase n=1 Tax=Pleionea mediterranea TaxID=523701 RepID=A0A316FBV5_9GAMM|nr:cob(I)yrinic acid a,c-diamide adenosyltransferase [Pleionea mediterranea]PWK46361.1 cob(I)yrinic acid a,c-diamide adenosyltransferase [Pleionea mediterranea]